MLRNVKSHRKHLLTIPTNKNSTNLVVGQTGINDDRLSLKYSKMFDWYIHHIKKYSN